MNIDVIRDGLQETWSALVTMTPRLLGALAILLAGWLVASVVRRLARRALDVAAVDRLLHTAGVRTADDTRYTPQALIAGVIYWLVLIVTFQLAADTVGATALSAALAGLVAYLPQVLVAVAILLVALALGGFVAGAVEANIRDGGQVAGRVARWGIVGFGAFAALSQLQLAEPIVNALFYATVATVGTTIVIAFGVGGIPTARSMLSRWTHTGTDRPAKAA